MPVDFGARTANKATGQRERGGEHGNKALWSTLALLLSRFCQLSAHKQTAWQFFVSFGFFLFSGQPLATCHMALATCHFATLDKVLSL